MIRLLIVANYATNSLPLSASCAIVALPPDLSGWLAYISAQHPQNVELGLSRVRQVWQALGASVPARQVITVAGTNGKGSCVALLQAILQAAGYRVGAYTSPHLLHYNERTVIADQSATDEALCAAFTAVEQARKGIPLTYFEYSTLAALHLFQQHQLDIALLEVGLGGRLDAVNIIDADVALITGIGLDHTDWLGDTLEAIGAEKAGIMRQGRPVVYAAPEMPDSIAITAQQVGADLLRLGHDYHYRASAHDWHWHTDELNRRALPLPNLRGAVQLQNAAAVLQVLACLSDHYPVDQQAIRQGLLNVTLSGRFEIHQRRARWILDTAHNPQAVAGLARQLGDYFVAGKVRAVVGLLQDKVSLDLFQAIAHRIDHWYLLDLSAAERGASAHGLQQVAQPEIAADTCTLCGDPAAGFALADQHSDPDDLVLVFGSFVTVAAAQRWLRQTPQYPASEASDADN
ncbi:MAG: bifunctional tetrahydrofolate synthase/dihydrofolate synthase [Pseudomonadota bacterium]